MHDPFAEFRLDGQVALVTGGSRGLGKEIARSLAAAGAKVAICSRSRQQCEQAAHELREDTAGAIEAYEADVAAPGAEKLVAHLAEKHGRLDILVNNAGIGHKQPILSLSDDDWQRVIDIDLTAPFRFARAAAPSMIRRRYGRIVNIASALAQVAFPGRAPYCAAKGGLLQLTRVMAVEWAEQGITVNAICPGPFETENNLRVQDDPVAFEHYLSIIPVRRWAECREIGPLALYLASPAAGFVTGAAFNIDGGWTAR